MAKSDWGTCPSCGSDQNGEWIWRHFYDRDSDMTVAYACPDCNHTWDREDD